MAYFGHFSAFSASTNCFSFSKISVSYAGGGMLLSKPIIVSYLGGKSSTALEFYKENRKNIFLKHFYLRDLFMSFFFMMK